MAVPVYAESINIEVNVSPTEVEFCHEFLICLYQRAAKLAENCL